MIEIIFTCDNCGKEERSSEIRDCAIKVPDGWSSEKEEDWHWCKACTEREIK